jgi:hypothetical protein
VSDIAKIITLIGLSGAGATGLGFIDVSAVDFHHLNNFNINNVHIKGAEQVIGEMKEAYSYFRQHGLTEAKRMLDMVKNAQK